MPFRSQAQWKWAFATDQPFAEEWAKMTPGGKRAFIKLAKRVGSKKTTKENVPNNPALWKKAIAVAKRKYDVYPSAYANGFATQWYKKRGGTWSKKDLNTDIQKVESTEKSDGYSPPQGVRSAAKRGLELRREFGRGGTAVGVARARDLSNGKSISRDTIKRMVSFFARHSVDKRPNWSDPSNPTNGYIAHLLWGGDAGRSWANKISRQIDSAERTKADEVTRDGKPVNYDARAGEVISGNLGRDASGRFTRVSGGGTLRQQIASAIKKPKKGGSKKRQASPEEIKKNAEATLESAGVSKEWYDTLNKLDDEPIEADKVADDEQIQELLSKGLLEKVNGIITTSTNGAKLAKAAESGKSGRVKLVIARAEEQKRQSDERKQERIDALDDRIESLVERYDSAKTDGVKTRLARRILSLLDKRDKLAS